jgi:hypothetical protein
VFGSVGNIYPLFFSPLFPSKREGRNFASDAFVRFLQYSVVQGLIALVREYLKGQDDVEADTMCTLRYNTCLLRSSDQGSAVPIAILNRIQIRYSQGLEDFVREK